MNVFISWSGDRSGAVANLLQDWLKCVIQSSRPWVSSKDIDRGSLWFNAIGDQLKDTTFGVICLTAENKDRPWILFEAGALAKGLATNRVCTFLIDLEPADITDPLAQFSHTLPTKESFYQLVATLNRSIGAEMALPAPILQRVFDTYWPQFETNFQKALADYPAGARPKKRDEKDMLVEILESIRGLSSRIGRLEESSVDQQLVFETDRQRRSTMKHLGEFFNSDQIHYVESLAKITNDINALNKAIKRNDKKDS